MISEESKSEKGEIIIRRETGLTQHPTGNSSALTEIINRSLVHIQTSKTLEEVQRTRVNELAVARFAGEEQEFEIAP